MRTIDESECAKRVCEMSFTRVGRISNILVLTYFYSLNNIQNAKNNPCHVIRCEILR